MLIVSCSRGGHLAKLIAKGVKADYSELIVSKFPDDELQIRLNADLLGKNIYFVQSFYGTVSDCIIEVILAAKTAKELGAKKIILIAPYFPYMRQDKRFHSGEAVSQKIIAELVGNYFDFIYTLDPHLHRTNRLGDVFKTKSKKLTANTLIAGYIKKNIKNPVVVGPDEESYKWARKVAEILGVESRILKKKRFSSYHVEVRLNKKIDFRNKNLVIVDDIISTGHKILETAKLLKRLGARKIYCICVHGIFADGALGKLKKAGIEVVSTNTIPSKVSRIDVSGLIARNL